MRLKHEFAVALKRLFYQQTGEPYNIPGHHLRFKIGTRPVRMRYRNSTIAEPRYDALQVEWLISKLHEGDIAIDVGANVGSYSVLMAALCGASGCVIAFEPDPKALNGLIENLRLNPCIKFPTIVPAACSDKRGESLFFCYPASARSTLVERDLPVGKPVAIEVQLVTLDSYLEAHGIPEPRWVKIDTEGAEVAVLRGAQRLLDSNAGIMCELHPFAWPDFGTSFEELQQLLSQHSRSIRYLDEKSDMTPGETPHYGTVILERMNR
jgi:FkbM family methyltransferase